MLRADDVAAIVRGDHGDAFAVLGMHRDGKGFAVRAFLPQAARVEVVDACSGADIAELRRVAQDGFFAADLPGRDGQRDGDIPLAYRLRLTVGDAAWEIDDPYRFGPVLGELDDYYLGEGRHVRLYEKLGAHPLTLDGVAGTAFAVWAPNAKRVSVVGDFNDWDGRRHPMRFRPGAGVWEIFLPGVAAGSAYKYELLAHDGRLLPLRADPLGFAAERSPATASLVFDPAALAWSDADWIATRAAVQGCDAPIAIYEAHLGSWKRGDGNRYLTYRELADDLVPYVAALGFTHIELMPVSEHPFDGSWGYQPVGLFAPTSRFGSPADFAAFVDCAHAAGIAVLADWVPGHFPADAHGLACFDGTHLYEHADPRQGFQPDWNTLIFNFERTEVVNFLVSNALFWLERYHVDGLRVDAVASMLYLDYSRNPGEWIPNRFGGRENLAAIAFLQRTNATVYGETSAVTVAEESTAWPGVCTRADQGGLGFGYKWNMGWMHDTLAYMREDPLHRGSHQNRMTFGFTYAFSENFVLPLSHDEVVHGKGSLLGKMPGDDWQRFANLRAYYGFMYAHPGKKLLFMGGEFAQEREWNHDRSLDWYLLEDPRHAGVHRLVGELNRTYRALPALHELDAEAAGFEWILSDPDSAVIAFARRGSDPDDLVVAISNFSPIVYRNYRVGVPAGGAYVAAINTDDVTYGGSGIAPGRVHAEEYSLHGKPFSLNMTLPPLATVILKRAR
ncbi:MAG: 1,4-alpha-glucan branching protein GlgB [Candidatus Eremiobacteraeota bacterium]|nr:1,4-alpha-glucan branching protein GlgB [Candidatus Eremiobacteraeota bacterium]